MTLQAIVLWGANNIFSLRTVEPNPSDVEARIKGKVLALTEDEHSPLAPGDVVELEITAEGNRIISRLDRRNRVFRWNRKREKPQTIAANVDQLFIVASILQPTLRPRFIDRVLAMAELESVPAALIVNKHDLGAPSRQNAEYLQALEEVGYEVYTVSVKTGEGMTALSEVLRNRTTVLMGQSGVGKSSLINQIYPEANQETGTVSHRFNRGRHTTTTARRIIADGTTVLVDTPGVREFDLFAYDETEIAAGFREIRRYIPDCKMPSCTHTHEPDCAVRRALAEGAIDETRYNSYTRIIDDLHRQGVYR